MIQHRPECPNAPAGVDRAVACLCPHAVKRTERGWAAHYILADRCRFRLNTLLELGSVRIIVSTVGDMLDSKGQHDTIGSERDYETKAFPAADEGPYVEIASALEIEIRGPSTIGTERLEGVSNRANEMHEAAVDELIDRMQKGDRFDEIKCPMCERVYKWTGSQTTICRSCQEA